MAINSACGPHCGIRANAEDTLTREAHCPCGTCHDGDAPAMSVSTIRGQDRASAPADLDGNPLRGTPMCTRWYELAGSYRPWQPPHMLIWDGPVADVNPRAPRPLTTARREPGGQDVPGGEGAIFGTQRAGG